jgi:hypothetical protein
MEVECRPTCTIRPVDGTHPPDIAITHGPTARPGTNGGRGERSVSMTDRRTETRRSKRTALHERLTAQKAERERKEGLVLAAAASGASFRAIARELGISLTHVRRLYGQAMARPGDKDVVEFKAVQMNRLNRLLFATWAESMKNDSLSVRNSLRIIQEMNRLEPGAYPRVAVDVSDTREHGDASIERVAAALSRIHARRERQCTLAPESTAVDNVDPEPYARLDGNTAFPISEISILNQ